MDSVLGWFRGASGGSANYTLGAQVTEFGGLSDWRMYSGTKKDDQSEVSIFRYDIKTGQANLACAKNAFKRLRTLRHPNILHCLEGTEDADSLQLVTEYVRPLRQVLEDVRRNEDGIALGLYQVLKALDFLNSDANLVHGNIGLGSVFVTKSGEFKLSGMDLVSDLSDDSSMLKTKAGQYGFHRGYRAPEMLSSAWPSADSGFTLDSFAFAGLVCAIFNDERAAEAREVGAIAKPLVPLYRKAISQSPRQRPSAKQWLECEFFSNQLVDTNAFLDQLAVKDEHEKNKFFTKLTDEMDKFPDDYNRFKILPCLSQAFQFGAANAKVLAPLIKAGSKLSEAEYQAKVVPCVVRMFASTDKAVRVSLLQSLDSFITHLSDATVNDTIIQYIVTGFQDPAPALRELTVKAMLPIVPKLKERTVDTLILGHLSQMQQDKEPGIRTNTTICLGMIANSLNQATRKKVLLPAFTRALADPFPLARVAGLRGFMHTQPNYTPEQVATRILPSLAMLCLDRDKDVRTHAVSALKSFVERLEEASNSMEVAPDGTVTTAAAAGTASPAKPAAGGVGWAGWAVSSLTSVVGGNKKPTDAVAKAKASPAAGASGGAGASGTPASGSSTPTTARVAQSPTSSARQTEDEGDGWKFDEDGWGDDPPAPTAPGSRFASKPAAKSGASAAAPMSLKKAPATTTTTTTASSAGDGWGNWGDDDDKPAAGSRLTAARDDDDKDDDNDAEGWGAMDGDAAFMELAGIKPKASATTASRTSAAPKASSSTATARTSATPRTLSMDSAPPVTATPPAPAASTAGDTDGWGAVGDWGDDSPAKVAPQRARKKSSLGAVRKTD